MKLSLPCGATKSCDVVTTHRSAYLTGNHLDGGIPVAYLGLLGYLVLTVIAIYRAVSNRESSRNLTTLGFVLSAIGALYSGYLTYTALYVINQTCIWCIASAITMVLTTIVYAAMLQADGKVEKPAGKQDGVLIGISTVVMVVSLGAMINGRIAAGDKLDGGQLDRIIKDKIELIGADDHIFGDPNAPVTIIEFADLLCPTCQTNYPILEELVKSSKGKIRLVFHHYPLVGAPGHEMAVPAATIAEMAADEGKFFPFIAAVYSKPNEEMKTQGTLMAIAKSMGMDEAKIQKRLNDENDPAIKRVVDDMNLGNQIKLTGTPSLFIQAKGGQVEAVTASRLESKLNEEPYKSLILGGGAAK